MCLVVIQTARANDKDPHLQHWSTPLCSFKGWLVSRPGVVVGVGSRTWGKVGRVGVVGRFDSYDNFCWTSIFPWPVWWTDSFATIRFAGVDLHLGWCNTAFHLGAILHELGWPVKHFAFDVARGLMFFFNWKDDARITEVWFPPIFHEKLKFWCFGELPTSFRKELFFWENWQDLPEGLEACHSIFGSVKACRHVMGLINEEQRTVTWHWSVSQFLDMFLKVLMLRIRESLVPSFTKKSMRNSWNLVQSWIWNPPTKLFELALGHVLIVVPRSLSIFRIVGTLWSQLCPFWLVLFPGIMTSAAWKIERYLGISFGGEKWCAMNSTWPTSHSQGIHTKAGMTLRARYLNDHGNNLCFESTPDLEVQWCRERTSFLSRFWIPSSASMIPR